MSGHSHWATIKRKKESSDAKRGKIFSKLAKDIMLAVRDGGPDPDTNAKLRFTIEKAKQVSMPKSNIERAIQKMAGGGEKDNLVELVYEGYGPGGVAIIVEVVTDNRNRAAAEIRKIFESKGSKLAATGAVSYLFDKKGWIGVKTSAISEDKLMEIVLDAGAENLNQNGDLFEITTKIVDFQTVKSAIEKAGIPIDSAELTQIPQNTVSLDDAVGKKVVDLIEKLEDHDDVQNVYSNYEMSNTLAASMEEES